MNPSHFSTIFKYTLWNTKHWFRSISLRSAVLQDSYHIHSHIVFEANGDDIIYRNPMQCLRFFNLSFLFNGLFNWMIGLILLLYAITHWEFYTNTTRPLRSWCLVIAFLHLGQSFVFYLFYKELSVIIKSPYMQRRQLAMAQHHHQSANRPIDRRLTLILMNLMDSNGWTIISWFTITAYLWLSIGLVWGYAEDNVYTHYVIRNIASIPTIQAEYPYITFRGLVLYLVAFTTCRSLLIYLFYYAICCSGSSTFTIEDSNITLERFFTDQSLLNTLNNPPMLRNFIPFNMDILPISYFSHKTFPKTLKQIKMPSDKVEPSLLSNTPSLLSSSCAICLEDFTEGTALRHLPCQHCFHRDCVDIWLTSKDTCPLCQASYLMMSSYQ